MDVEFVFDGTKFIVTFRDKNGYDDIVYAKKVNRGGPWSSVTKILSRSSLYDPAFIQVLRQASIELLEKC